MGGMIWDIGSASHEATEIDERAARYVNDKLAEYLVPVNADIGEVEVIMLPEEGDKSNPLGSRAWANSATSAPTQPSRTRCSTPPASVCAPADTAGEPVVAPAPGAGASRPAPRR